MSNQNFAMKRRRYQWKAAILVLIMVGILKEFRPSAPFLVDYAVDHKNFTGEQMTHEVLPATTGTSIISLIFLTMVTDAFSYKPIIVNAGVYNCITWVITIWGFYSVNLARLSIDQVLSCVKFSTPFPPLLLTSLISPTCTPTLRKVTTNGSHPTRIRPSILASSFPGVTGQVLISFNLMDFEELNYLSLAGGVGAVLFSIMLPRVLRDVEEEKARKSGDQNDPEQPINQGEKDAENDEEDSQTDSTEETEFRDGNQLEKNVLRIPRTQPKNIH
ncbi:folate-like transporter 2 [Folsomia candida]|uniref:folate-like transporter 2 n=1 Tax=Folsomia candida TaxID=158441 RepID=UPI001604A875|nr:folate-like transporter 2 [Folsomia candida]